MENDGNKDFWIGTAVGVGVGLLAYYMFTQIKSASAAPALTTTTTATPTTHSITLDGTTFSVAVKVGDTVTLVPQTGASFQSVTNSNALLFNSDITVAPFSAVIAGAGSAVLTVLDTAGKTTNLTLVAS